MRERITTGETTFRKAYLRSIVDAIEVDDKVIRIHGSKASLEQTVIAGEQIGKGVRSFIRKWRAQGDSNPIAIGLGEGLSLFRTGYSLWRKSCRIPLRMRASLHKEGVARSV